MEGARRQPSKSVKTRGERVAVNIAHTHASARAHCQVFGLYTCQLVPLNPKKRGMITMPRFTVLGARQEVDQV